MNFRPGMLSACWEYLKYVLHHKYLVAKVCFANGMYWHGITHDLSKFLPSEFFPYVEKFKMPEYECPTLRQKVEDRFKVACDLHYARNRHHYQHWQSKNGQVERMPITYIHQMICDWEAMGLKFGDSARSYWNHKWETMNIHFDVRLDIDREIRFWLRS